MSETTTRENPFTYGNPISDPGRFFGRQREIDQVFSRLRNVEFESSSLVGERRVGKTSLLNYIAHPDVRRAYGLDPDRYVFVTVDLQMVDRSTTPLRLWQRLLRQMERQCQNVEVTRLLSQMRTVEELDSWALADLFETIDKHDQHLVLLLDEFENVTENPNFETDFFYGLRSLAIHHNLSLVTSSRRELIDLCHSEAIRSSPFFNIFANINVPLLSEDEARTLIERSLRETGTTFSKDEVGALLRMAGRHPYFLQAAAHFLFEARQRALAPSDQLRYMLKEFADEAAPHLADYWHNSDDEERIVLTALALLERANAPQQPTPRRTFRLSQLHELYSRSEHTLNRLDKRGLVVASDSGDTYSLLSSTLATWIARELTATQDEGPHDYEAWARSNGGLLESLPTRIKGEVAEMLPQVSSSYRELLVKWVSDPRNVVAAATLLRGAFGM